MSLMQYLHNIYPYDPDHKIFTVHAALDTYEELYNYLDPSPAPSRDLAPDVVEYLDQCSEEIPLKFGIHIIMHICEQPRDENLEAECLASIKTYYQHEILLSNLEKRRNTFRSLRFLGISLLSLTIYLLTQQWADISLLTTLVHEAILIGSWVFMWEVASATLIDNDLPKLTRQRATRLVEAPIEFIYGQKTD